MNVKSVTNEPLIISGRDVTAILGPTNTGKTHLAIERMVAHRSGMIGLPLRLLAREVYGRVAERVGADNVALITGEEKIQPPDARYSVCTVEAMPRETSVAFVAIDEVQLAGDLERGHVFTDRILNLRGREETLLLGAATMRGILEKLLKGVSVVTRPRMSHLAYTGQKKLTRLPRRSAIVAFSADEVYGIGELIRRQRGGVAVVLGALSPRTRNAQVAIYQSGDVDFLVATDAIGMGLNLDVDHVAFAQDRKFDGHQFRRLNPAELGQIAGRAGRHVRDGTFGVTGRVDPFSDQLVEKLESHDFDPVRVMQWRTASFDYSSLQALKRSIETPPPVEGLAKALPAVDAQALERLSLDPQVSTLADRPQRVALLWDACALPDYRKIAPAQHADLVATIFHDLARLGHVDESYMADQVRRADSSDGDIDTLSHRIAHIRTWTFVSHRPGWLADPTHWQEKTREIEDRLSDALHERLTKRFVDRRTSVLMRRLREDSMPEAEISSTGDVLVEGHHIGEFQGFRFTVDQSAGGEDARALRNAAQKALALEFAARAERFAAAGNSDLVLGSDGTLRWIGAPVATLTASEDRLKPRVILLADDQLTSPAREKVLARAERFVNFQVSLLLKPLLDLQNADQLSGLARGIAFQLAESFGLLNRRDIAEDVRSLDQAGRASLRRLGVRFGAYHVFVPALLKPAPASLMTLLWALQNDGKDKPGFGDVVHALASGRTSLVTDPAFERSYYRLAGYRLLGRRAVRVDILERLADLIRPALNWKPGAGQRPDAAFEGGTFMVTPAMMSILGATAADMEEILKGLGYRCEPRMPGEIAAGLARLADQEKAAEPPAAVGHSEEPAGTAVSGPASEAKLPDHVEAAAQGATSAANEQSTEAGITDSDEEGAAMPAPDLAGGLGTRGDDAASLGLRDDDASAEGGSPIQPGEGASTDAGRARAGDETVDAAANVNHSGETTVPEPADEEPRPVLIWRSARFDVRARKQRHDSRNTRRARTSHGREEGRSPEKRGDKAGAKRSFPDETRGSKKRRVGEGHKGGRAPDDNNGLREKRREASFDPDSPFAKLAALRDQLKK